MKIRFRLGLHFCFSARLKASETWLTAAWVSRAKHKPYKPYKPSDRDGLYFLVEPCGSRVWRMNSRFFGKQKTITFGRWPALLLGDARERLLDARRRLAKGLAAVEQAKLEKITKSLAAAHTRVAIGRGR